LNPPARVDTLAITQKYSATSTVGLNAAWQPGTESDAASYNLYACHRTTNYFGCDTKDGSNGGAGYTKLATLNQLVPPSELTYSNNSIDLQCDPTWCFYVESCDNCKAAGTCPDKPGTESNCSTFSTLSSYRKCIYITDCGFISQAVPHWPPPQQQDGREIKITSLPEGNKCKLEWNKICEGEDATHSSIDFNKKCDMCPSGNCTPNPCNCDFPDAMQLTGYKVMRAEATNNDCSKTVVPPPMGIYRPVAYPGISAFPAYTDGVKMADGSYDLENNKKYCYRVYGYNGGGKYSPDPPPTPVECIPRDTLAPDKPVITNLAQDDASCKVTWDAVTDKDTPVYTVFRCNGNMATCYNSLSFATMTDAIDIADTQYSDVSVASGQQYIYCVTARDASGNASLKREPASHTNCTDVCWPGHRPKCKSPGAVTAFETADQYGGRVNYQKSPDDAGTTYAAGQGYKVYLFSSASLTSCTAPATPDSPLTNPLKQFGNDITFSKLPANVEGDYYLGVTYTGQADVCEESKPTLSSLPSASGGKIHVRNSELSICSETKKPKGCTRGVVFHSSDLAPCRLATDPDCRTDAYKKIETPISGAKVEVYDTGAPNVVIILKIPDKDGKVPTFYIPPVTTGNAFSMRARIPLSQVSDEFKTTSCAIDGTDCLVDLSAWLWGVLADPIVPPNVIIPGAVGAGGGESGNPNCDGVVDIKDMMSEKSPFKTKVGDCCYRPWADFNMKSVIHVADIAFIKKNFKVNFGAVPENAFLCRSKFDPLPACCNTGKCNAMTCQ
jgi:hypothetical protein